MKAEGQDTQEEFNIEMQRISTRKNVDKIRK